MSIPNNFHVLAMPLYWLLSISPHALAINVASGGNPLRWDNRNPRSSNLKANVKSRLTPEKWALYERAESASANAYENMPFFYGAILVGKLSGIDSGTLDSFAASFLAARVLHTATYLAGTTQAISFGRSAVFFYSIWLCVKVYLKAARIKG